MAGITAAQSTSSPSAAAFTRPYAPSWFDRFMGWVDRLPFPAPLFYLGLALVLLGIQILLSWNSWGGTFHGFPLVFVFTLPYHLALMHYLDQVAANALARVRPLLLVSEAQYDDFHYRLTTLPNRGVLVAAFFGVVYAILVIVIIPFEMQINELHFADTPAARIFNYGFAPILFSFVGVLIYHAIHQLNVVRQIYDGCIKIDLFTLRPLYAFSSLSGLTVVGIGFNTYLWFLTSPALLGFNLGFLLIFIGVAALTFLLPLRGAHDMLVEEKERLLSENGERHRVMIAELHRYVDTNDLGKMDNLNKVLTSLELERTLLERISTWPWQPGTIRAVVAALLFPVVVWLLQWVLERILT